MTIKIGEGAFTHRVRIAVPSIERALKIAKAGKAGHRMCLVFPIDPEKEDELLVAEAMFGILGGTFRSFIAWLYGLPFLLLGLAVALSDEYPRWLGWVAVVAGAGAVVAGTTLFLDVPLVPFPLLFGGFVIPLNIWLAVIGLLMWRRAALPTRHPANKR